MSASKEWFEYHLTPEGWVEGSSKFDTGGIHKKDIPVDRVLTLEFHEFMSSPFSKMDTWYTENWRHLDSTLVETLVKLYDEKPKSYKNYKKK